MEQLIREGRYQILHYLHQNANYEAYVGIDIAEQGTYKPYLFNVYSNQEVIRTYLQMYYDLDKTLLTSYRELNIAKQGLIAQFDYYEGESFLAYALAHTKQFELEERIYYLNQVFSLYLLADKMPEPMAYAYMAKESMVLNRGNSQVYANYLLVPTSYVPERFKSQYVTEWIEILFPKGRYIPDEIKQYVEEATRANTEAMVEWYAQWRALMPVIEKRHKELKEESIFKYVLRVIRNKCKRK